MERPPLSVDMKESELTSFYYLKEELQTFCRQLGIPCTGSKDDLIQRICTFLGKGEITRSEKIVRNAGVPSSPEDAIPPGVTFSEGLRAFFKENIGNGFKFNVTFCKWLRDNPGRPYSDAISVYPETLTVKKTIGRQFKYNTYIRDFFADNPDLGLDDAIKCWNRKKMTSSQIYEKSDLGFLE